MKRSLLMLLVLALALAACGQAADEDTTTTAPETTTEDTDATETTEASEATTTTSGTDETTTTTGEEVEGTGDLAQLQAAMAQSAESGPSRIEGVMSVEVPDEGTAEMPMSIMVDPETGNSSMSMDMAAMAQASGEDDMPAEMAEMMGTMEVRTIGDTVYMRFPFFTAFLGAETEWVSMPAEDDDMADDMTSGPAPDNPGHFLESFSDAEGSVEELGSEEIRGVSTTHYRLTVNENWQEHLSDEELEDLEEQGPLPDASFPIELWVGDDGLVHRMAMDLSNIEDDEEFESMSMTFDFFDFGESVTIEAPPADQVTDMENLSGPFGGLEEMEDMEDMAP